MGLRTNGTAGGKGGGISCQRRYLLPNEAVISPEVRSVHSSRAWRGEQGVRGDFGEADEKGVDRV